MAHSAWPELKNDLILRVCKGEAVLKAPVWIMRQAGRYLPEFRDIRAKHSFFEVCRTPELACEVTMQPLRRYEGIIDASIIFSDILVVPQALGMVVEMKEGRGPVFECPITCPEDLTKFKSTSDAIAELNYVFEAISLTRKTINGQVPLFGFTGAPWTLMSYMIEGGPSKTLSKSKRWLYTMPEASHHLLQLITDVCVEYLFQQVKAGAQLLQVFESHAEHLGPGLFATFSLPYLNQICDKVKDKLKAEKLDNIPMSVFAKGGGHHSLKGLSLSNYEVIGLDWTIDPDEARLIVGDGKILQGNFDPCGLYASEKDIELSVGKMVKSFGTTPGKCKGWIVNLGHGIYPDVNPSHLEAFLKAVDIQTQANENE